MQQHTIVQLHFFAGAFLLARNQKKARVYSKKINAFPKALCYNTKYVIHVML